MTLDKMISLLQKVQEEDGHDYITDLVCDAEYIVKALQDYRDIVLTLFECPDCMAKLQIVEGKNNKLKLQLVKHET